MYRAQDGVVFKGGIEARNYELSELLGIQLLPRGNVGERCECISGKHITVANVLVCIFFSMMDLKRHYKYSTTTGNHFRISQAVDIFTAESFKY